MKIKEITIQNFRSYYGENSIKLDDGLTLVIGDNGDGKTTFFEALEWLFDTTFTKNEDSNLISAKSLSELLSNQSDIVRVAMLFDHDGEKLIEKQFTFSKDDDKINITDFKFVGLENIGSERTSIKGNDLLERCFDTAIRKYCLFKGERELNVFDNPKAMELLLKYFSNIRDFDTYLSFAEYAETESKKALENFLKKDKKNQFEINKLNEEITNHNKELLKIISDRKNKETEAAKYTGFISNIEQNAKISSMLNDLNIRLDSLNENQKNLNLTVNENYTIRLLDEMWILCGFSEIFKKYQEKIKAVSREKRKLEDEDKKQKGKQEAYQEVSKSFANGILPLPICIPDKDTMQEMIEDEVCKVCGREAKQGTDAYHFMVDKLNELLKSREPKEESEEQPFFCNNFISELEQDSIRLDNQNELNSLLSQIKKEISFIKTQKSKISEIQKNIIQTEEDKIKLLAQSDNLSEQELTNQFHNISEWVKRKTDAEKEIPLLKKREEAISRKLSELKQDYNAIAKDSQGSVFVKINTALEKINNAFKSAKNKNTEEFFVLLEEKSNQYLEKLNIEDFHGIIKLEQRPLPNNEKTAEIVLRDNQNNVIHNPNTALKTTVYMSVLFGISEITTIKRENDYPLIFDAPTSSFSDAKESDFFNVISGIEKQCIIFTKSFLTKDNNSGRNILDRSQIKSLKGTVYQIEKERPFIKDDLSTIRTIITPI